MTSPCFYSGPALVLPHDAQIVGVKSLETLWFVYRWQLHTQNAGNFDWALAPGSVSLKDCLKPTITTCLISSLSAPAEVKPCRSASCDLCTEAVYRSVVEPKERSSWVLSEKSFMKTPISTSCLLVPSIEKLFPWPTNERILGGWKCYSYILEPFAMLE